MYICMYVSMYVCTYVCIYIYNIKNRNFIEQKVMQISSW